MTSLEEVIRHSPVIVHRERYAVAHVRTVAAEGHFAILTDDCETTVVTTEARLANCDAKQVEKPFAMLEFRVAVPFQAPGFLAAICTRLAERAINVLVYSTFSRDYVLVPWLDLEESIRALEEAGFVVNQPADLAVR